MSDITGKTILITGAGSGVGQAIARRFHNDGATVIGSDINAAGLAELAGLARVITMRADVTVYEDVQAMVDLAVARTGRVDVVINNAGNGIFTQVAETDPAAFRLVQDVHVNGCLHGMRAALPVMLARGGGRIINVISRVAETQTRGASAYAAAKAGMWALSRVAAAEVEEAGVQVNMIFPGMSRTGLTAGGQMGDPALLGEPDQDYATFLQLATLPAGSPVGQVWSQGRVYTMFQNNDLSDLAARFAAGATR